MPYFFVDPVNGSDSTGDGTWSKPVKTIGKAIGPTGLFTLSTVATNYLVLLAGVYREVVNFSVSPTSSGPLVITSDWDGAYQRAAGATSPVLGGVEWLGWTNDTTPITTSETIVASNKSYVTIEKLKILGSHGGAAGIFNIGGVWSDWTIRDCILVSPIGKPYIAWVGAVAGASVNLTFERCLFWTNGSGMGLQLFVPLHTSEYDVGVRVRNNLFFGCSSGVRVTNSLTGAFTGTGLEIQNNTFFYCSFAFNTQIASGVPATVPSKFHGNYVAFGGGGVGANHASHIVEDGNLLYCSTPRTGVGTGANSKTLMAPRFDLGDWRLYGGSLRPFAEPTALGPLVSFGNFGTVPATDYFNQARPAVAAVGAIERDVFPSGAGTVHIFQVEG